MRGPRAALPLALAAGLLRGASGDGDPAGLGLEVANIVA
jgi:hypothetical protein